MVRKFPCLLLLLFAVVLQVTAQDTRMIRGVIVDKDGQGLPYVSIGIVNTPYGTVSDESGNYKMQLPAAAKAKDSLKFSCIGYDSRTVLVGNIVREFLPVKMDIVPMVLNEVMVKPTHTETEIIGITHKKGMMANNFAISGEAGQNLGAEIGERFELGGERNFLDTLNVFVNANSFDTVAFRINIYNIQNGMPGKSLLDRNIWFTLFNQDKGWIALDLKPYHLVFDEDVIVSLQWIRHSQKGTALSLPITIPALGHVHYYKFGSQGVWKKYTNMATSMNLKVEQEIK
ncbi:MAG: carboxypeptidase-like regulatory domain-containing protein [Flavipsychrobacter sp.]|nr:carboxypeptidase-like regulatory domain-containing protein [Flavipsychrobacter sp.]